MTSVSLPLRDADGRERGTLMVSALRNGPSPTTNGSVELLEGQQYRYALRGVTKVVQLEPAELFSEDDSSRGRITPKQHVGTLVVVVHCSEGELSTAIEIKPTKLAETDEYNRMLSDITAHAAEAVLQGFAPTSVKAALGSPPGELLYQRFAILESHLRSEQFAAAVERILGNPHIEWRTTTERQSPGSAYPQGSGLGRAFASPGPRRPWLEDRDRPALASMPAMFERSRHAATLDTAPNRFVKYLLESWRAIAEQMRDGLASKNSKPKPGPVRRGLQVANEAINTINDVLALPLFRQIGDLNRFPSNSQVLLRREGYRQLLEMFVLIEAGLELPWESDAEDVYSPSLRNAAKLYEIWCYLTLVNVLGRVCGLQQIADAFTPSANGLSLLLKTGVNSAIRWHTTRRDRPIEIQLMYNRQFAARQESWTAAMHPDCSILIRPLALAPGTESLDVWVHFDAKYKIRSTPIIDRLPEEDDDEQPSRGSAKPEDLLKMHAYRDAIHRTAGAYVLYPGDVSLKHEQFSETLPGLGAFPLRPDGNETHGVEEIVKFLTGVLDHVADQATQHERERFWRARIRASPPPNYPTLSPAPFLDRPPADTDVLVGYVRGPRHRAWIERNRLYNVRADDRTGSLRLGGRELGARLVLLVGQPYFVT